MCRRSICLIVLLAFGPVGALTAGELIKINFQLASAPVPEGYLPDGGQLFGDQGNGYTYGWSQDMSDSTRDRNSGNAPDQRYDTLIHFFARGAVWEIELLPGTYRVFIVCGDPSNADSNNAIELEGELLAEDPDGLDSFDEFEFRVLVTDGRLTWSEPAGSYVKPCFIEIESSKPLVKATKPDPEDGALLADTWVNLSWTPGELAVSHDVYFSDSLDDVNDGTEAAFQGNVADDFFIVGFPGFPYPEGLVPGTTYYWRVDEINDAEPNSPWAGDVWSFSIPSKKAHDPSPADGATFMLTDVELSWTQGFGSKLHTVYFGDDLEAVANATGGQPQAVAAFTPGTLASETTYYWRVDEFDPPATHKGDVWSFSTVPDIPIADPNLLCWWKFDAEAGSTALDHSGHGQHGRLEGDAQWVDGMVGGALEFDGTGDRVVDDTAASYLNGLDAITVCMWIKSDLVGTNKGFINGEDPDGGDNFVTMRYDVAGANGGGTNVLKMAVTSTEAEQQLESSNNAQATDWQHVAMVWASGQQLAFYIDGRLNAPTDNYAATTGTTTGCTKLIIGAGSNDASGGWDGLIDDVRIYDKALTAEEIAEVMRGEPDLAWNPSPANRSTPDVRSATPLTWLPGDLAAQHDVYFGTERDAVDNADASDTSGIYRGRQNLTSYLPSEDVAWGSGPYYWRIDEFNSDGTISKGRIWSFAVADFLLVDDFETYTDNDAEGEAIWQHWLDGYGVNTNGSQTGYTIPPYAERAIVHGGAQSMPLQYNNTAGVSNSEVELTLTSSRDWTEQGVTQLSLWFRGDPANAAEPLYVALSNTTGAPAIVPYTNPAAATVSTWTEWPIPLQAFADKGINLANIDKIAIGLGSTGGTAAGGTGTMYFDDIRLYRP